MSDGFGLPLFLITSISAFSAVGLGAYVVGRSSRSEDIEDQDSNIVATENAA
jgi:hypothetical protein